MKKYYKGSKIDEKEYRNKKDSSIIVLYIEETGFVFFESR